MLQTRKRYVQTGKDCPGCRHLNYPDGVHRPRHVQNTKNNCSYDYLLHPAISISKIIGGCGPAANQ